jgi:hypothetical protein
VPHLPRKHTSWIRNPLGCNSISHSIQQQALYCIITKASIQKHLVLQRASAAKIAVNNNPYSVPQHLAYNSSYHEVPQHPNKHIQQCVLEPPGWLSTATDANNPFSGQQPVLRIRIRDPVPFWPLDPEWVFPGSRIPNPYFWELSDNFWVKSSIILSKLTQIFFLQHFKNKIIYNFVQFVATKKVWKKKKFFTPLLSCCFWIRDPGSEMDKNQDPGSGINIPDPQHCLVRWPAASLRKQIPTAEAYIATAI